MPFGAVNGRPVSSSFLITVFTVHPRTVIKSGPCSGKFVGNCFFWGDPAPPPPFYYLQGLQPKIQSRRGGGGRGGGEGNAGGESLSRKLKWPPPPLPNTHKVGKRGLGGGLEIKVWGHRKGLSVVDSRLTLKHRLLEMCRGITGLASVNLLHLFIFQFGCCCAGFWREGFSS